VGNRDAFLVEQIQTLAPFDFLTIFSPQVPVLTIEVARDESGRLEVNLEPPLELDGAAPLPAAQSGALTALGFVRRGTGWRQETPPADPTQATATVLGVLNGLGAPDGGALDVVHGSRRLEHEAHLKLAALRARLEPLLAQLLGHPAEKDDDGDYVLEFGGAQVYVAPGAAPGVPVVIRIFSITNVGMQVSPELGLFLARLNFGLMFGRFALDVDHSAVWFSETLLGEQVTDEEFLFTVRMVAQTANAWEDRIAQMFGGYTHATAGAEQKEFQARTKPGEGGYL
jgi:hypothetical protein